MKARKRPEKYEILYELSEVVEAISREPELVENDESYKYVVKLTRTMALIASLPTSLIDKKLASKRCLTAYKEYLADWPDTIPPPRGWSNDLLARVPSAETLVSHPYLNSDIF